MRRIRFLFFSLASLLLLFSLGFAGAALLKDPPAAAESDGADALPTVGSYEQLKRLLKEREQASPWLRAGAAMENAAAPAAKAAAPAAPATGSTGPAADHSTTNVQVQGVDEADLVKTDGTYLYQVNGPRVLIVKAYPADEMKLVSAITFDDPSFTPRELYVDDRRLIVIGSRYAPSGEGIPLSKKMPSRALPPVAEAPVTRAIVYDILDKAHVKKLRDVSVEGEYLSSRKIGASLYLVANRYLDVYRILNEKAEVAGPAYADSALGTQGAWRTLPYTEIRYFPDFREPNYLLVAGLNLDDPKQAMRVSAYLGAGQQIYASPEHLYVAVTGYEWQKPNVLAEIAIAPADPPEARTRIYKFRLNAGNVTYLARGEVPGSVLNQFSMDEYDGMFRIATTAGDVWRTDEHTAKNNVYVLDESLKMAGKLENLAPGERIYSVRFMGARAYLVTFQQVDPLFVLDLKDPRAPKILGALKIPGYSDYLHPYDENHLIGFGKDTVVAKRYPGGGAMAFYQGMKVALFDVTDVAHPKELFKETIGGRGTDSDLLHDHKALLFSREKQLLAFPVTVREAEQVTGAPDVTAYGRFTFQGAYVYQLNLDRGFVLKGKITHLDADDLVKAGYDWYDSAKNVQRIVYIQDTLYTLSQAKIKAHSWPTLREVASLDLGK